MILQTVSFMLCLKDFVLAEPSGQSGVMRIGDSKITVIGPNDFNCNNEQGFLPARQQCNKYYVCDPWNKLGILKTCPRGTLFDPLDLKCRKSEDVRCDDFACPNRRNRPDETDSKTFISCKSRYHPRRFRCLPEGTVYDADIDMCIWPSLYSSQVTEIGVQTDEINDQGVTSTVSTVTTSKSDGELSGTLNKSDATVCSCDFDYVVNLILCVLLVVAICLLIIMVVIVSCLYDAYRMHLRLVQSFRNETEGHDEIIQLDHTHTTGPSPIDTTSHYYYDSCSTQNYQT